MRTGLTSFEVRVFTFDTSVDGNKTLQPYYNFHPSSMTITPNDTSGNSKTLTTSAAYFVYLQWLALSILVQITRSVL